MTEQEREMLKALLANLVTASVEQKDFEADELSPSCHSTSA